jgi:hypothetical protein
MALHATLRLPARPRLRAVRRHEARNEFGLTKTEEAALAAEYAAGPAATPSAEQLKEYRRLGALMRAAG